MTLEKWTRPDSYWGETPYEYYVLIGQHRDSPLIDRNNFTVALEMLGGEDGEQVRVKRASHWAVGWIESILIHENAAEKLEIARRIDEDLEQYPILDEDRYTEALYEEVYDWWASLPLRDRVDLCEFHGVNIFAARRTDDIPERIEQALEQSIG